MTIIIGNLTKDVEIKYFDSGKCKASFSIATNTYDYKTKEQKPNYFNIEAWDKNAEFISEHYSKGKTISLLGNYKEDKYTKDGEEKVRKYFNTTKVVYSGVFETLTGYVTRLENRVTPNDKKIQYVKLDSSDITIVNRTKTEFIEDAQCVVFGELIQNEKDYILEVVSADVKAVAQERYGTEEQIPF